MLDVLMFAAAATAEMPSFMAGCWNMADGDRWTEECWTAPRAGLMLGSSREGRGDALKLWEWMRIERAPDGTMTFYASPRGAPPTAFTLDRADADEVSFVNAGHDFPQRVTYRLKDGALEGEISRLDGHGAVRWRYRRPQAAR